jgi:aminoglycoside phosphotransferase (APT) family kinase protein
VIGSPVAGAQDVREEDAFDIPAVEAWLQDKVPGQIAEVRQFSGGASNLTYLMRVAPTGSAGGCSGTRDLILRRPPGGTKAKGAHDMAREHRIQGSLAPVFPYVATMVGYCDDLSVIGSEFYVMDRVDGHIPRRELGLDLSPEQVRELCTNVLDLLVDLHTVDPAEAGLESLGKGEGYVARQVGGWISRFARVKTWNVPSWGPVMRWLDESQPADRRTCLIHNDFRLDNVVLANEDPTRPIALLDWEMATLGDPLMDLGSAVSYWVEADDARLYQRFRMQPSNEPGMLTRHEVVDYYSARTGISLTDEEWAFYEVFGLFRLAVILQQIYYRYHHRQTTNPKFKNYWLGSHVLHRRARALMRQVGA